MTPVDVPSKHLLIMGLCFNAMLYSKMRNENSNVVCHIKCSHDPHLACRLQVPHPCPRGLREEVC